MNTLNLNRIAILLTLAWIASLIIGLKLIA